MLSLKTSPTSEVFLRRRDATPLLHRNTGSAPRNNCIAPQLANLRNSPILYAEVLLERRRCITMLLW